MAYPILFGQTDEFQEARRTRTPYPCSVPWELVAEHEAQAQSTHGQSLSRLAERGGLSPMELWCVVHDKNWIVARKEGMTEAKAIEWLRGISKVEWRVP